MYSIYVSCMRVCLGKGILCTLCLNMNVEVRVYYSVFKHECLGKGILLCVYSMFKHECVMYVLPHVVSLGKGILLHECVMYVLPHVVRLIYFYSALESSLGCVWRCSSQPKGRDRCGEGQK